MAAASSSSSTMTSQPVFLTTHTQYPLPTQKYMIPTTWKRYQLSQLVNKALSLDKPVPFDFLVKGEILRTSLSEWCAENGVGEVCILLFILDVYSFFFLGGVRKKPFRLSILSRLCRLKKCQISHMKNGYHLSPVKLKSLFFYHIRSPKKKFNRTCSHFLTASYDGQIRAFDYSKTLVSSSLLHPAPITSLCVISSNDEEGSYTIATSSHDLTAQFSQLTLRPSSMDIDGSTPSTSISTSKPLASLHLHTAPVSSVSSNSTGTHLLTSSWDGLIGLWDTTIPSSDEVQEPELNERDRKKRRKLEDSDKPRRKAPLSVLKSHTARVSKVLFAPTGDTSTDNNGEKKKAYSCGFDSTVRFWDTEYGVCENTIVNLSPFPLSLHSNLFFF